MDCFGRQEEFCRQGDLTVSKGCGLSKEPQPFGKHSEHKTSIETVLAAKESSAGRVISMRAKDLAYSKNLEQFGQHSSVKQASRQF